MTDVCARAQGQGKAYLTYTTDTNISAAVQMCALNDSLEERVNGDGDIYPVRETSAQRARHHATAREREKHRLRAIRSSHTQAPIRARAYSGHTKRNYHATGR